MTTPRFALAMMLLGLSVPAAALAQDVAYREAQDHTAAGDLQRPVAVEIPPPEATQELRLRDGSCLYGRVTAIETDTITFRTSAGVNVTVPRADITSLAIAEGRIANGEFLPADPNATRLFFGPTARALPRGQGYLGVYELLLPTLQVGVTDRLSIGGGTLLIFGGGGGRPVWITPKVQLYSGGRTAVAAGVIHFFVPGGDPDVGVAYGNATFGHRDSALTAGVGYAYAAGHGGSGTAVVMIGGEQRASRRVKLITENYLWRDGGLVSGGVRFLGDRLSADLGLVAPLHTETAFAFPFVSFVWMFR